MLLVNKAASLSAVHNTRKHHTRLQAVMAPAAADTVDRFDQSAGAFPSHTISHCAFCCSTVVRDNHWSSCCNIICSTCLLLAGPLPAITPPELPAAASKPFELRSSRCISLTAAAAATSIRGPMPLTACSTYTYRTRDHNTHGWLQGLSATPAVHAMPSQWHLSCCLIGSSKR